MALERAVGPPGAVARAQSKQIQRFKNWLAAQGAEVLPETNEWELVRFSANGVTSILYTNKRGDRTFVGEARAAWRAYLDSGNGKTDSRWRVSGKAKRKQLGSVRERQIRERDGDACFYCGRPAVVSYTVEHLVPLSCGGPHHVANLVLAHPRCNEQAGNLSVAEKVRLRDRLRQPTD